MFNQENYNNCIDIENKQLINVLFADIYINNERELSQKVFLIYLIMADTPEAEESVIFFYDATRYTRSNISHSPFIHHHNISLEGNYIMQNHYLR